MVVIPTICLLGIILNTFTAVAFRRFPPAMLIFRVQLFSRSIADMVTLMLVLPVGLLRCRTCSSSFRTSAAWQVFSDVYQYRIYLPVTNISSTCSTWITALVSAQRCIATRQIHVVNRLRLSPWCTVGLLVTLATIISSPYFFTATGNADNIMDFLGTPKDGQFQIYSWVRVTLANFIPTVVVAVVNGVLAYDIWRARKSRLIHECRKPEEDKNSKNERTLTVMLIGISVGFLLAHVPESFSNSGVFRSMFGQCSVYHYPYRYFRLFSNILEMLSHSVNFFIYSVWNEQFRRLVRGMCAPRQNRIGALKE